MQTALGIFVAALPLYGLVRIGGHNGVYLNDTKEVYHSYDLQTGIFWDAATVKKYNRANDTVFSCSRMVSISPMTIKHTPWSDNSP